MNRVNSIIDNKLYKEKYDELQILEANRIFCNHGMEHFLAVARLMYIRELENHKLLTDAGQPTEYNEMIPKHIIYAVALMHDIGRVDQIKEGIPHELASAALCDEILPGCGYTEEEICIIKTAILGHRQKNEQGDRLAVLLYTCDKASRNCFACKAKSECNWDQEKMNLEIMI